MAAQNIVFEHGNNNEGEEGNKSSNTETTNSTPPFTRAIRDVVSLCKLRRIVVAFLLALFPFPVENEFHLDLEIILTARKRNSQKKIHPCESRCLLLKFSNEIAPVVFTGECIFPEGTKLELVDSATGQQVRHGPLAFAEVEIFLLNGDENWTIEEISRHIMMQKRCGQSGCGKNPYLRLEGGVVSVNEIKFKHTPKHMKKLEMVRLGARLVDQSEEVIVKEAVTGPFTLKDKRLKNQKRHPPSPTDDVWRLEQICRNGVFHDRLTKNGIRTVEDFLIGLHINPQRLRDILGKGMSDKNWKKATTHAKTCNTDGGKYLCYHLETEQKVVVFDVAGQVISLDSGCGLGHFNILSESQKAYARKLVETAFANWEKVLKFDNDISMMEHFSSSKFSPSSCPAVDDFRHSDQLQLTSMSNFSQRTAESNQWVVSAHECSSSYAIFGQHAESDWMSLDIPAPGHTATPNQITSANSDSADCLEKIMQHLNSDELQFEDFPYGEPGQANYCAAETSATQFHGLQHGETMDHSFTHLMNSENDQFIIHEGGINANQQRQMNNVSMVPVASMCKGKSKKSWTKISSILRWFFLKRFVKLKKDRINKKRKFSR